MSFKPLHLAGPNKKSKKADKKPPTNEHTSGDEYEEFGEEIAGGIVDEIDDEMIGDDEGADDLKEVVAKEEKTDAKIKHIEIVDNESAEVKLKDVQKVEKEPVKDIKELTEVIENNELEEIVDVHSEQILDVSNIEQDDLEDY